ncbi:MAG TPA: N-acetyl-gamma-glutamyl-phosphate reductase, partial [Candidatus Angelobacter sp.]|nr:N-acetyl-gamma-glutamyl-phosphate reductase [Candidatus Angelobacter sp.]
MNNYSTQHGVGVVGFRGYSGAELVRILRKHPGVDVTLLE